MGDTQHSLRFLRRSGRLPWRVPLRFPARAGRRLRPAAIAAATLMIVAVLSLASLVSSPAFALPAKAKLKIPHVPLAQVPWQRHFSHPTPIFIPPMSLPWADCHVLALHIPHPPVGKWKDPDCNFIMAMCQDRQGNLWLATEGAGVYRYDPSAAQGQRWTQFTKQSTHGGLENNCIYAIACDNQDRIWVGELNHGISVFNGRRWQDYDIVQNPKHHVLAGPLGNHVYAMKFDRYTDQMWICTENGISVYQCRHIAASLPAVKSSHQNSTHHWHYITQASGLPMNPDSIAFASNGMVYVGTQCGGLAIGTPTQGRQSDDALGWNYYRWTVIKGPWHMPLTATGKGLPGNLVNSVVVTWKNHLAVGTDEGMALGEINEQSAAGHVPQANLTFQHGQNFVAKVHGLWHPPKHWQAPPGQVLETLPTEDHTTAVAWEPDKASGGKAGYLWLGHWRTGLDVWQYDAEGAIIRRWHIHEPQVGNYIESLQPLKGGAMAVGCYGAGIRIITLPGQSKDAWRDVAKTAAQLAAAPEPQGARPPSERELNAMAAAIRKELLESKGGKQPRIVPLPDDWRTEGNWLGRYGRYWSCLFACCKAPPDYVWAPGPTPLHHVETMGPHHYAGDAIRYWVEWIATANPRVLELPAVYLDSRVVLGLTKRSVGRRESEIDDHGESYPVAWQGPGIRLVLQIPPGAYTLSFYFYNYNGHSGSNRDRDYLASLTTRPVRLAPAKALNGRGPLAVRENPRLVDGAMARCRVTGFFGGAWVRFLVRGPSVARLRLSRNCSFNTMLAGAMLDPLAQHPKPYYSAGETALAADHPGAMPADTVIAALGRTERYNPAAYSEGDPLGYASALRECLGAGAQHGQRVEVEECYYHLSMYRKWEASERSLGILTSREIERGLRWDRTRGTYRGIEAVVIARYAAKLRARAKGLRMSAPSGHAPRG